MAAVCALACLISITWYLGRSGRGTIANTPSAPPPDSVFLFDSGDLVSVCGQAQRLLAGVEGEDDWDRVRACLSTRFPNFPGTQDGLPDQGITLIDPADPSDTHHVVIEPLEATTRIEVARREPRQTPAAAAPSASGTLNKELDLLRDVTKHAPCPIWKIDASGREVWHNAAYRVLYQAASSSAPEPDQPLFPNLSTSMSAPSRQPIELADRDDPAWYDITSLSQDGDLIFYAVDVAPIVMAETTQRNFVQTLAKTFAQLSTGLAIFDRQMQLVLFNPALVDLTALPVDFLSGRPNLLSFFDRLRDGQIMPEPKDYGSWRDKMTAMVAAANDGSYRETWTLPSGSTYQVTGRPHPDGAVAFLFEDISAEVSLTRRFRADLELNQGILDQLPDAIAVFSATGILTVTNASYRQLWHVDPETSLSETTILDAMRDWQAIAGPDTLWGELRDFILGRENRTVWTAHVTTPDKVDYLCTIHPILNGSTLLQMTRQGSQDMAETPGRLRLAR